MLIFVENTELYGIESFNLGPRFSSSLERALFFGKFNLVLVMASVSTTTLFYSSLIRLSLFTYYHVMCCPPGPGSLDDQFSFADFSSSLGEISMYLTTV